MELIRILVNYVMADERARSHQAEAFHQSGGRKG